MQKKIKNNVCMCMHIKYTPGRPTSNPARTIVCIVRAERS